MHSIQLSYERTSFRRLLFCGKKNSDASHFYKGLVVFTHGDRQVGQILLDFNHFIKFPLLGALGKIGENHIFGSSLKGVLRNHWGCLANFAGYLRRC